MQRALLSLFFVSLCLNFFGQKVSFDVSITPESPKQNQKLLLKYELNISGEGVLDEPQNFKLLSEIKGASVLMGPATSTTSNISQINGVKSETKKVIYTYALEPNNGILYIPAAMVSVNGKKYTTLAKQFKIHSDADYKVSLKDESSTKSEAKAGVVSKNDVFVKAIASKSKIEGDETVTVTYKLYTANSNTHIDNMTFPDFEGFDIYSVPNDTAKTTVETIKGKKYTVVSFSPKELTPRRIGKITIQPLKMNIVTAVKTGEKVKSFFGPQDVMEEVRVELISESLVISVVSQPKRELKDPKKSKAAIGEKKKIEKDNPRQQSSRRKGIIKKKKK